MTGVGRTTGRRWLTAGASLVLALVGGRWLALEIAERTWAASIPGGEVYTAARDLARLVSGIVLLLSVAWGTVHFYYVYRAIGSVQMPRRLGDLEIVEAVSRRVLLGGVVVSGLLYGIVLAWGTGEWWLAATVAGARPRFGVTDPVLGRDWGYYLAELPWASTRQGFALLGAATATALAALLYVGIGALRLEGGRLTASPHARTHLGALLACIALALAWGAILDPAELVAARGDALDRAALAVHVPGATFVTVVAVLTAAVSLVWAWRGGANALAGSWSGLLLALIAVNGVLPALARRAGDEPGAPADARLEAERSALERAALGLDQLPLSAEPPPAFASAETAASALPIWDPDRIAARARAARALGPGTAVGPIAPWHDELASAPSATRPTWLVAPAIAADTAEARVRVGPPVLAIETDTGLAFVPAPARDTAVWFGPGFTGFALAAPDTWPALAAGAGIPLAGWWRRGALAWTLQSLALARSESRGLAVVWRRDARERVQRVAPFAVFEAPAPVLTAGELWWVAYGYLAAESFPLARPLLWRSQERRVRYLRPGLVGAVHAATGDTRLYLVPGHDSLAAAWGRLFAPLVQPAESLPPALHATLPFPADAFAAAVAHVLRTRPATAPWQPLGRPFAFAALSVGRWLGQAFATTDSNPRVAALLAGTMSPDGPRLLLWEPARFTAVPAPLLGSPETKPGVARLWPVRSGAQGGIGGGGGSGGSGRGNGGGNLVALQGLFAEAAGDRAPPRLVAVYAALDGRTGQGATAAGAVRGVLGSLATTPTDTSLTARWAAARRLAAQADSFLTIGDLERFGIVYEQLKRVLGIGRSRLPPPPRPD